MKKIIGLLLIVLSVGLIGIRVGKKMALKHNVTGYLKRASDASTAKMAHVELSKAISYLEAHGLTNGYTSVLWKTPADDLGFWYQNLKASQQILANLQNPSTLEESNVLMRLRETLTDNSDKGKVSVPSFLSVYPNQKLWAGLTFLALVSFVAGLGLVLPKEAFESGKDN
jgi:hypothetical protein